MASDSVRAISGCLDKRQCDIPENEEAPTGCRRYHENQLRQYQLEVGAETDALAPSAVLTKSFSSLLGLKKGIFLALTSTFSPVFGLRPTRPRRSRVRKLPNPRISIFSPFCSAPIMLSKMVSTMVSDSLRGNSVTRRTSSMRSAFVSVGCLVIVPSPRWLLEKCRNNPLRSHPRP